MAGLLRAARPTPGLQGRLPLYAAWVGYGGLIGSTVGLWLLNLAQAGSFTALIPRLDFMTPYLGMRLVATGQSAHLYDLATNIALQKAIAGPYYIHQLEFTYPAWDAVVFAPLGLLPYSAAFLIWAAINLLAIVISTVWLVQDTATSRREGLIMVLAVLSFTPVLFALWQGQTPLPCLLGLAGAWHYLRRRQETAAGAWLLFTVIKPPLVIGPVLALLVMRRWRMLAVFSAGSALVLGLSLLVAGNWLPAYLDFLRYYTGQGASTGDIPFLMQNWRGLINALLGTDQGLAAQGLITGLTILSLALVVVICWPRRSAGLATAQPSWEVRFAVSILLGVLIDPHAYLHDLVVLLVPGFILWRAAAGPAPHLRWLRLALLAGPLVTRIAISWSPPVIQPGAWYIVVLLLLVWWAWPLPGASPSVAVALTAEPQRR